MKKYFSYHPENGFYLHDTAEEAQEFAKDNLDADREEAGEGWPEHTDQICWGELKQHVVETHRRPRTDEDTFVSDDCSMVVDYALADI